jgi:hypothetical protein
MLPFKRLQAKILEYIDNDIGNIVSGLPFKA